MPRNPVSYYKVDLLPHPNILKELERHSQGAAEEIMQRAETLQQQSFRRNEKMMEWKYNKGILSSLFRMFSGKRAQENPYHQEKNYMEDSFAAVGDYMRQAMRDYIADHKINIDALELTPYEKFDLSLTDSRYARQNLRQARNHSSSHKSPHGKP